MNYQTHLNPGLGVMGCIFGLLSLWYAVAVWLGRSDRLRFTIVRQYQIQSGRRRNAAFAGLPTGLFLVAGGLAGVHDWPAAMEVTLALIGAAGLAASWRIMTSSPDWAKPPWFRAEEAAGFPSLNSPPPRITLVLRLRMVLFGVVTSAAVGLVIAFLSTAAIGAIAAAITGAAVVISYVKMERKHRAAS